MRGHGGAADTMPPEAFEPKSSRASSREVFGQRTRRSVHTCSRQTWPRVRLDAMAALPTVDDFKATVVRDWTSDQTVEAWRRWHPRMAAMSKGATDALVTAAAPQSGERVLDLACGTGTPSLTIAGLVAPVGRVTATDLSSGMLAVARDNAAAAGITNIDFRVADAHDLPFGGGAFDLVTARFGAMFWPDEAAAFDQIRRVLAPGGRVALVTWGPPTQDFFASFFDVIAAHGVSPASPPPPEAPNAFRYADPHVLAAALTAAGFHDILVAPTVVPWTWDGPAVELWQHMYETAPPLRPFIDGLPAPERDAVVGELINSLSRFSTDGTAIDRLTAEIVVARAVA